MSMIRVAEMMKAANRYEVLLKVEDGTLTNGECAQLLGLSVRQVIRLKKQMQSGGLSHLVKRAHVSKQHVSLEEKTEILRLRRECYASYNVLHFQETLLNSHNLKRSYEFLRKLLLKEGLHQLKKSRVAKRKHRQRFEAPAAGLLVQRDTSIHLWVESLNKKLKLILDIDDHSRKIVGAVFSERDDVLSNMLVSWETISTHGVPIAYYMDNNPIYNPIRHLQGKPKHYSFYRYRHVNEDEKQTLPQFKRALHELGINCIHSTPYQPQGKGKVERIFRFMQDRLVKEMETMGVKTIHEANRALQKWVTWYNHFHRHRITEMIPNERYLLNNSFRELAKEVNLENVFSLRYTRTVSPDNTISFQGFTYQIKPNAYRISYARAKVDVRVTMDQKVKIFHQKRCIGVYKYKQKNIKDLNYGCDIDRSN